MEASAPPNKGGQVLRRELMRGPATTSDEVGKQAMAMGGQLMMRAAAGQQVCPGPCCCGAEMASRGSILCHSAPEPSRGSHAEQSILEAM